MLPIRSDDNNQSNRGLGSHFEWGWVKSTADMVVVRTPCGMHVPGVLVGTSPKSCKNEVTVTMVWGPTRDFSQTMLWRRRMSNGWKQPEDIVFASQDIDIGLPLRY